MRSMKVYAFCTAGYRGWKSKEMVYSLETYWGTTQDLLPSK